MVTDRSSHDPKACGNSTGPQTLLIKFLPEPLLTALAAPQFCNTSGQCPGNWVRTGAARTWISAHKGCWHHRQVIIPLYTIPALCPQFFIHYSFPLFIHFLSVLMFICFCNGLGPVLLWVQQNMSPRWLSSSLGDKPQRKKMSK